MHIPSYFPTTWCIHPLEHLFLDLAALPAFVETCEHLRDVEPHELPHDPSTSVRQLSMVSAPWMRTRCMWFEFDGVVRVLVDGLEVQERQCACVLKLDFFVVRCAPELGGSELADAPPEDAPREDFVEGLEDNESVLEVLEETIH